MSKTHTFSLIAAFASCVLLYIRRNITLQTKPNASQSTLGKRDTTHPKITPVLDLRGNLSGGIAINQDVIFCYIFYMIHNKPMVLYAIRVNNNIDHYDRCLCTPAHTWVK